MWSSAMLRQTEATGLIVWTKGSWGAPTSIAITSSSSCITTSTREVPMLPAATVR